MTNTPDLMAGYAAYTSALELSAAVDEAPAYTPTLSISGTCLTPILTLVNGC
jgi:hypothetical protein